MQSEGLTNKKIPPEHAAHRTSGADQPNESIRRISTMARKEIHTTVIDSSIRSRVLVPSMSFYSPGATIEETQNRREPIKNPCCALLHTTGAFVARLSPVYHEQGTPNNKNESLGKSRILLQIDRLGRSAPSLDWQSANARLGHATCRIQVVVASMSLNLSGQYVDRVVWVCGIAQSGVS